MLLRAKTLLAGTAIVTLLSTLGSAVASDGDYAPAAVYNHQFLTGPGYEAGQTVKVDIAETAAAAAAALGNTASAHQVASDMSVENRQELDAPGSSEARLEVGTFVRSGNVTATTIGNGLAASTHEGYIGLHSEQTASAHSDLSAYAEATGGSLNGMAVNAAATANALSAQTFNGDVFGLSRQRNEANVRASAFVDAPVLGLSNYVGAQAIGNAVTTHAVYGGTDHTVIQENEAHSIEARTGVYTQETDTLHASSSAIGNSIHADHGFGFGALAGFQSNSADVTSYTDVSADLVLEGLSANAFAAGNTSSLSVIGSSALAENQQYNSGDILAGVTLGNSLGGGGYLQSSALAIGNSVSGFACAECGARIEAFNYQTNTGSVSAYNTLHAGGTIGGAAATAIAIGNAATFGASNGH